MLCISINRKTITHHSNSFILKNKTNRMYVHYMGGTLGSHWKQSFGSHWKQSFVLIWKVNLEVNETKSSHGC